MLGKDGSLDSKSYRIYNTETRRVRSSRNVVFIETAPVPSSLDERGFDDGEFTYDDHDEMLRDVHNYTFNHSVDSLSPEPVSYTHLTLPTKA